MKRELRDELEVPGHVVMIKSITVKEAKEKINKILDKYEQEGKSKLKEIPEGKDKEELRILFKSLGMKIDF